MVLLASDGEKEGPVAEHEARLGDIRQGTGIRVFLNLHRVEEGQNWSK